MMGFTTEGFNNPAAFQSFTRKVPICEGAAIARDCQDNDVGSITIVGS